jgi:hypothetical protein
MTPAVARAYEDQFPVQVAGGMEAGDDLCHPSFLVKLVSISISVDLSLRNEEFICRTVELFISCQFSARIYRVDIAHQLQCQCSSRK